MTVVHLIHCSFIFSLLNTIVAPIAHTGGHIMNTNYNDKRQNVRNEIIAPGQIIYLSRGLRLGKTVRCMVINVSARGALICAETDVTAPEFYLEFSTEPGTLRLCKVVRKLNDKKHGVQLGVQFVEPMGVTVIVHFSIRRMTRKQANHVSGVNNKVHCQRNPCVLMTRDSDLIDAEALCVTLSKLNPFAADSNLHNQAGLRDV